MHSALPKAKKQLGQNFLINPKIVDRIIRAAELSADDLVVEVGPGPGVLTRELVRHCRRVRAIELDRDLVPALEALARDQKFVPHSNLEIIHADALTTSLPHEPYKVVANIPYYITSPLLNHFLEPKPKTTNEAANETSAHEMNEAPHDGKKSAELRPTLMVLMVQKEVAEKICAKTGQHSVLSLQVQIFGKPEIIATVGKGNFLPQPQVDSAILKIEVYPEPLIGDATATFFQLIHAAFAQKRKTLLNSLQNGLKLSKAEATSLLTQAGIAVNERPQNLAIEDWQKLIKARLAP